MKVGVILPSFQDTPELALDVAARADRLGLDGVFCFDHLWPMGQPERPAIAAFPLLATVAVRTAGVCVGTLVARIGLVPDEVLLAEFAALERLAPGRVIAAIGTGDHLSAGENAAFGVPAATAEERRAALAYCARTLMARGLPVWIGGGGRRTVAVAEAIGAAVNLWDATLEAVAEQAVRCAVTWAGPVPRVADPDPADHGPGSTVPTDRPLDEEAVEGMLRALAGVGAGWAVYAWPAPLELLAASSERNAPSN